MRCTASYEELELEINVTEESIDIGIYKDSPHTNHLAYVSKIAINSPVTNKLCWDAARIGSHGINTSSSDQLAMYRAALNLAILLKGILDCDDPILEFDHWLQNN